VIVGQGALMRPDAPALLAASWKLAGAIGALTLDWHGFNVLHTAASRVAALDMGFVPGPQGRGLDAMMRGGVDLLWLLGADEFDTAAIGPDTFVVYQGHHGDRGASRADVILPGAAYTEKNGTYVNIEGRVQRGFLATFPPGEAREDWKIIRAFSEIVGRRLPFDDIDGLRAAMEQAHPSFARLDYARLAATEQSGPAGDAGAVVDAPLIPAIADYYLTNPISRASVTMAECSRLYTHGGKIEAPKQAAE
jgi:NADH-quinone oxidoreductase subunit G